MIRLLASTALASLAPFCVPAAAQTAGGLQLGAIRSATQVQPCIFVRGSNICDPFGVLDLTTGAFTPPPLVIPYTPLMLNTNTDLFRVQIGNLPQSQEFPALDPTGVNKTTSGIVCALASPNSTTGYAGALTWPDGCFASYTIANQPQKSMINYLAWGSVGVDGGFVQILNAIASNKPIGPDSGTGFNAAHVNGIELDMKVYPLAVGAMTGDMYAYQAFFDSPTTGAYASLSASAAFRTVGFGAGKWNISYLSEPASATFALVAGPMAVTGPSNSQSIILQSYNGAGVTQGAQIQFDSGANLLLLNNTASETFGLFASYPQLLYSQGIAGAVGIKIKNTATGGAVSSNSILETGTASSFYQVLLADAGDVTLSTGIGQIVLSPISNVKITTPLILSALSAGYVKAPGGSSAVTTVAIIPAADGGTGQASYTIGDLLYASSATALSKLPDIAIGNVLLSGGVGAAPSWGKVANSALSNSTISGVALGSNLFALTFGTHLTGTSYNGSAAVTIATDATNANTASAIVARDASGNFIAGTITASLTGHSSLDLQASNNLSDLGSAITARSNLGLGTAATVNTGTSGATIPLLNGANTFSALNTFSAGLAVSVSATAAVTIDASGQSAISVSSGSCTALAFDNMGKIVVTEAGVTGWTAEYILGSGQTLLTAAIGNWQTNSTSPAAGYNSVGWNGSAFAVCNNTGGTRFYKIVNLRTH